MVGISGIIKLLHSKHGNTFPITTTRAIYSENTGKCLDDILNDVMLSSAEDINAINNKIGNLDELTTTEKGSLVGAVTELNNNLANKANKNWALLYDSGYINWTEYKAITVPNFGSYSEMLFVSQWYTNPYSSIILPVDSFKKRNNQNSRLIMQVAEHSIEIYYISNTQIAVYDSVGTNDVLEIFVR